MTHINQRRDYATNWTAANPILQLGEVGWERDTLKAKLGNGATPWNSLPYAVGGSSGGGSGGAVTSVANRTGDVILTKSDVGLTNVDNTSDVAKPVSTAQQTALNLKANAANAALTGVPTAPTAAAATDTTQIATTAFVKDQGYLTAVPATYAPLASPALTGTPTAPTAPVADNDTQIATTAFVKSQAYATLASPVLSGAPTTPTAAVATDSLQIASTAYVKDAIQGSLIALGNITGAVSLSASLTASTAVNAVVTAVLTGNVTITAATMPAVAAGTQFVVRFTQDATGSRTLTLTTIKRPGAVLTLSTAANAVDLVVFFYDGASWYASLSGKGFA